MDVLGILSSLCNIVINCASLLSAVQAPVLNPVQTVVNVAGALGAKLGIFNGQAVTPQAVSLGGSSANIAVPINSSGLGIMSGIKNATSIGSLAGQAVSMSSGGSISGTSQTVKKLAGTDNVYGGPPASDNSGMLILGIGAALLGAKALGIKFPKFF